MHTGRGALALGAWSGFSLEASASRAWAGVRAFWHLRTRARCAFDQLRRAAGGGACALRGVGFALRVGYVPRASERLVAHRERVRRSGYGAPCLRREPARSRG